MGKHDAINKYHKTTKSVDALLSILDGLSDPPNRFDYPKDVGLKAGIAVLIVAQFEDFIRSEIEAHVDRIPRAKCKKGFSKLPEAMQKQSVKTGLQLAIKPLPWNRISHWPNHLASIQHTSNLVKSNILVASAFTDTGGNPDSEKVGDLLRVFGVKDPFSRIDPYFQTSWGSPVAQNFTRDKLDEIVRRRNLVAHTGGTEGFSRVDLHDALKFMRALCDSIHSFLIAHFGAIVASL